MTEKAPESSKDFEKWYVAVGSKLPLSVDSPRNIQQLYEDIQKGEVAVTQLDSREWIRIGVAVATPSTTDLPLNSCALE